MGRYFSLCVIFRSKFYKTRATMSDSEDLSGDDGGQGEKFLFKTEFNKVDELPPEVFKRVKALKNIQLDNVKHEVEYYKELHKLDLKYQKIYDENNVKRKQIYLGEYEPTDLECEWVDNDDDGEKKLSKMTIEDTKEKVKGIPDFWLTVFQNANDTVLHGTVEQIDEPILKSLQDVTVTLPESNTGFSLNFHFAPNDYFSNSVLTKEYELRNDYDKEDPLDYDGPEVVKAKGCQIDWKPGKNPGIKIITKKIKPKGKGKGGPKLVKKEEKRETFFDFFKPPDMPEKKETEEETEALELLNEDFDIGLNIKEKLIPKAVLYFTGEIGDLEMDDDDDDDEFGDEDSDSD